LFQDWKEMVSLLRVWILVLLLGPCVIPGSVNALEPRNREFTLSLLRPTEINQVEEQFDSAIERLLSKPLWDIQAPTVKLPFTDAYVQRKKSAEKNLPPLMPGYSLNLGSQTWAKIASLEPIASASKRPVAFVSDEAPDPQALYSSFEIQVDHSKYTLWVFGFNE
jgi:hypothetical protein